MNRKLLKSRLLIDGLGSEPIKDGAVLIEGNRISKVGSKEDIRVQGDAVEIDASDSIIMPGLIDCHVHLASESSGKRINPELWELKTPFLLKVFHAANNARKTIEGGFTTVRNMGHQWSGDPPWDAALRDAINQGLMYGPRILASINLIGMTASHGDIFLPFFYSVRPIKIADGVEDCRLAVRENVRAGADFIKITTSGGGVLGWGDKPEWRNYTTDEIRAITDEAHAFGKKVAAHAVGVQGIKNAIECGVDTVEHGYLIDEETIMQMKDKGTRLIPTLTAVHSMLTFGKDMGIPDGVIEGIRQLEDGYLKNLKFAYKAGLKMALGTDIAGTWSLHGQNAKELSLRVNLLGLSPMDAILSATKIAAETSGLNDLGTLKPGNRADVLVVKGDPLQNITILEDRSNISMVVKEGEVVIDRRVNA
jgi:imidazolonepropionase-like amidohydrolase